MPSFQLLHLVALVAVSSAFVIRTTDDSEASVRKFFEGDIIVPAFEMFRLKSCIDFKPYEGEKSYLQFEKLDGCWSFVGDFQTGQNVSIGLRCEYKDTVEHEVLHALGFYHEQSRSDRDDYVNIWWDEIIKGQEHNFNKYDDSFISDLNTPYDYESVMHYGPYSFNINSSIPSITTKIPEFNDVIGQSQDLSRIDLQRLNRMYNCGESAILESRILYPRRNEKCLQFFYKFDGSLQDELIIWIKSDDGTGNVRKLAKLQSISANGEQNWNLATIPFSSRTKFRYVFHGIKGNTSSSPGGISIDGITSSTSRSYLGIMFALCSSQNDGVLEWPAGNRQVTFTIVDQDPDITQRMSASRSFTTNPEEPYIVEDPGTCGNRSARAFQASNVPRSRKIQHLLQNNDADAGELRKDIPEINSAAGLSLFQGDILLPKRRSALRDERYRWKLPVPFILSDNLDQAHNFKKYGSNYLNDLNTPYDYESIMHYGPFSFGKNSSLATITTNIPEFNDIIGQRLDFSTSDIERLNHMYNCNAGYFMYFNTSCGKQGDTAILESRILYPKRKQQCLQFFFKMTGSSQDRLAIWVKTDDGTGNVRRLVKIRTFQGDSDHDWKIAHVNLKCQKKFRFLFHGLKGNPDDSAGGIYIDDLTLSETQCPRGVWLIRNFSQLLTTAPEGYSMHSPRFYSPEGYGYGLTLSPRGLRGSAFANYTRISFHLVSGENDGVLEWPALHRQVTITVLDQNPNARKRMSSERSFTTTQAQTFQGR
ncbi:hypothetical protein JD844_023430 [Phrynosoma platyrhinos]|uniref:Metalloendopeptidase n=1 Tax=Phrynosoma platyrhinos TaxID=52577 RepID=A0ABQ7SWT3_PHRPL|nr:hypothetical protein JD844_023430 [Phrynosoma platyrhinos]